MKQVKLLLISFCFGSLVIAQSGTIVLNKGQKFNMENTISTNSTQEVMGQSMESHVNITTNSSLEVKETKGSNYDLTNNIGRMQMHFTMSGGMAQDMSFDSDKKEDMSSDQGASLKKVINHPIDVSMSNTGKIISTPKTEKKENGDMTSMIIGKALGDPGDGSYGVNIIFLPIPANAAVGYTWSDSLSTEGSKKFTTYSIKEFQGTDVIVGIVGSMDVNIKAEMQGMEIVTKSKGTVKGEEVVDRASGVLRSLKTTTETTGTVEAQGMDIPMNTKITSEIKVTKGS